MENVLTTRTISNYVNEILANFEIDPDMDGSTLRANMDLYDQDDVQIIGRYTHVVEYLEGTQNLSASQNIAIRDMLESGP